MGYQAYSEAQGLIESLGEPLLAFTGVMAAATLATSLLALYRPENRSLAKRFQVLTVAALAASFLLVIQLHLAINTIEIGFSSQDAFTFAVAPWTESEKPLFWALLLGAFSASLWRREDDVASLTSAFFAVLVILMVLLDPPFPEPLPTLQGALEAWQTASGGERFQLYGRLRGLSAFYGSNYMWIHPPTLFIAYTALVVTLAGSAMVLVGRDGWTPTYAYSTFGYIALTGGLLFGYPWAVDAWADKAWWWDPKIGGSLMMWTFYTAYLHFGLYHREHRRWTGVLGVLCFVSLVFTYMLTYLVEGVHTVA